MPSKFFGGQSECRFYTAGCGNKMAVSVTRPRAVNELGGPVIPGKLCLGTMPSMCHRLLRVYFHGWFWGVSFDCQWGSLTYGHIKPYRDNLIIAPCWDWRIHPSCIMQLENHSAGIRHTAVTAHLKNEQLLLFIFGLQRQATIISHLENKHVPLFVFWLQQRQTAVTAYLKSKQLLPLVFGL